ncbi:MAG: hypothetical protein FWH14_03825 [Oscillospiraceae bacterium]|nr:hypothetical protein [Oscillospiraceae bacterium]
MRVSTYGMVRNYNKLLSRAMVQMNNANMKVITGKNFLRASESPAEAAKAKSMNKQYERNENYLRNIRDTKGMFDTMFDSKMMIMNSITEVREDDVERAINGTMTDDERMIFSEKLRGMQEQLVMNLNASYNDQFLFGGTGTKGNPPFKFEEGKLYYRGLDVEDPDNQDALSQLADETVYLDFGFGISFSEPGKVIPGSAFNVSAPGINFIGFGLDEDGMSNNIIVALGNLADALSPPYDVEKTGEIFDKLKTQRQFLLEDITLMGASTKFLESTEKRLEDQQFHLENRLQQVFFKEPAEAIMDFQMRQYTYNAALKMGSNILSPSFIDFMR